MTSHSEVGDGPDAREAPSGAPEGRLKWRTRTWLAVASIVGIVGIAAAALVADTAADNRAEEAFHDFEQESNAIGSTLRVAIQRDQALMESTAAFVTVNQATTNAELTEWADALRWRERYPEVLGFGFARPVAAGELDRFLSRMEADPIDPSTRGDELAVVPPGERAEYCLAALGQYRTRTVVDLPAATDYCAGVAGIPMRIIRDTGEALYYPLATGEETALAVTVPAYAGGEVPASIEARRERFVGWMGLTLAQQQLLEGALARHPGLAATLQHGQGDPGTTFTSGNAPADGRSATIELDGGWSLTTVASVPSGALFADGSSLAMLGAGIALSLLLASLVFVLGTGRARARQLVVERTGELRHQAVHDALTGLPNRALIVDRTEQLLARNRRRGAAGAALFIDLDDFKNVNDTLGHEAGDRLLVAVAARLRGTLREVDTIGRLGGDEFVVLIDGGEFRAGPELVAERLLDVMRHPFELEGAGAPLTVSASIGIAIGHRASAGEMLRDADVALYEAKAAGKNRYEIFDSEMRMEVSNRIELEFDLRSALEDEQFRLVYQPIYDLDELTVVGVEALLRWEHPVEGTIPPNRFIPVLERSGQIREVGRWVLREACRQMVVWRSRGDSLDISINVSGRQLDHDSVVEDISAALSDTGLDPACVIIEVTETALMKSVEATTRRLHEIKALGVRIAVDDFGTGYSSLAYLKQFPVDCLKIDREFTNAIATSPESDALIGTLVQLGKDLGLATLAEGIERPGQIDHLRGEHVNEGQGFLLSRPLDPETLEERVLAPLRPQVAGAAHS